MVVHTYTPSNLGGAGRRTGVPGQPRQKCEILSKTYLQPARAGRVAQVVEYLLSKCEFNPSIATKEEEEEEESTQVPLILGIILSEDSCVTQNFY
jgi:hypothetical protein